MPASGSSGTHKDYGNLPQTPLPEKRQRAGVSQFPFLWWCTPNSHDAINATQTHQREEAVVSAVQSGSVTVGLYPLVLAAGLLPVYPLPTSIITIPLYMYL